jgi:hypothetical protein
MNTTRQLKAPFAAALLALAGSMSAHAATGDKVVKFGMVRSAALNAVPACVPNAKATVKITPGGITETMNVSVSGLPANTDFDFFVIQVPGAPFGLSWYQGDIETDAWGNGTAKFIGRFSQETFIVAPGVAPAPQTEPTDASSNPATGPIQTYHLGLWFNSPADAVAAGCPGTVTPFNGDHDAGIQVLNTGNFPDLQGPLLKIKP